MVHTTLNIEEEILKAAKDQGINLSACLERALKIELGLDSELKLLLKQEEELKVKLALIEQKKIVLSTKKIVSQTTFNCEGQSYEKDVAILQKSYMDSIHEKSNNFHKVLPAFCQKYGIERNTAISYLTGKRKTMKE